MQENPSKLINPERCLPGFRHYNHGTERVQKTDAEGRPPVSEPIPRHKHTMKGTIHKAGIVTPASCITFPHFFAPHLLEGG